MSIVVVGSCMIDFISYTPRLPRVGETIHGTKFETGFGGKGANQCVAAAKLGGDCAFIARVGDDTWGPKYIEKLQKEKIDTTHVQITNNITTGVAQITVDSKGENHIVIVAGANLKLTVDDLMKAREIISKAKVVLLQLEIPLEVVIKVMEICKGGITILNASPVLNTMDPAVLAMPTILCINETEAALFADQPVQNINQAKVAIMTILRKGCKSVIVTMGKDGALYASKEAPDPVHIGAPKVSAKDTTGAGDQFTGALAYLLANRNDLPIEQAIEIANHIAALSVTKHGTQTSYVDAEKYHEIITKLKLSP